MLRTTPPRTAVAPARSSARRSSGQDRASAHRGLAAWTGSAPGPTPAPARNVLFPRSLQRSRVRLRRRSIGLRRALSCTRCPLGNRGFCAIIRFGAVIVSPVPLLLQRVRNILGHVGLVMLGEHGIRLENACGTECAFDDPTTPFPQQ